MNKVKTQNTVSSLLSTHLVVEVVRRLVTNEDSGFQPHLVDIWCVKQLDLQPGVSQREVSSDASGGIHI